MGSWEQNVGWKGGKSPKYLLLQEDGGRGPELPGPSTSPTEVYRAGRGPPGGHATEVLRAGGWLPGLPHSQRSMGWWMGGFEPWRSFWNLLNLSCMYNCAGKIYTPVGCLLK